MDLSWNQCRIVDGRIVVRHRGVVRVVGDVGHLLALVDQSPSLELEARGYSVPPTKEKNRNMIRNYSK